MADSVRDTFAISRLTRTLAVESPAPHLDTLLRLETQHEQLLLQLDELDKRVVKVLSECQPNSRPEDATAQPSAG